MQCRGYTRFLFFIVLTGFIGVLRNDSGNYQLTDTATRRDAINQNNNPSVSSYNQRYLDVTGDYPYQSTKRIGRLVKEKGIKLHLF